MACCPPLSCGRPGSPARIGLSAAFLHTVCRGFAYVAKKPYLCRLNNMKNYIPKYLTEKQNVIWLVCGTALFGEVFILLFQPFGSREWAPAGAAGDWIYLGVATAVVLVAMGIIAISRTIMYQYGKRHAIEYWQLAVWIFAEASAMSLVYTLVPALFMNVDRTFFSLLKEALLYTGCIMAIPYTVASMVFSLRDKERQLQLQRELPQADDSRPGNEMLHFCDERGELKMSMRSETLYYIESADNYVMIYYRTGGRVQHYMLRSSLRRIEDEFSQTTDLVRCHRSYIVNLQNVKLLQRTDEGLLLDFDTEGIGKLPVSKTYAPMVVERLMK